MKKIAKTEVDSKNDKYINHEQLKIKIISDIKNIFYNGKKNID